jgi:phytoene dehydrogenase-like protein
MHYDAIIIGAGHNGLTTAAYLAKAGRKVLMLERRDIVGGCAVTEEVDPELAPGCRVSTASYIASMLRPTIIKDLKLISYGLKMVTCDPGMQAAFDDGDVVGWWSDEDKMRASAARNISLCAALDLSCRVCGYQRVTVNPPLLNCLLSISTIAFRPTN